MELLAWIMFHATSWAALVFGCDVLASGKLSVTMEFGSFAAVLSAATVFGITIGTGMGGDPSRATIVFLYAAATTTVLASSPKIAFDTLTGRTLPLRFFFSFTVYFATLFTIARFAPANVVFSLPSYLLALTVAFYYIRIFAIRARGQWYAWPGGLLLALLSSVFLVACLIECQRNNLDWALSLRIAEGMQFWKWFPRSPALSCWPGTSIFVSLCLVYYLWRKRKRRAEPE